MVVYPPTVLSTLLPHFEEIPHVFVGSRATGAYTPFSDWDFAFCDLHKDRVKAAIDYYGCHTTVYSLRQNPKNSSLKFSVDIPAHIEPFLSKDKLKGPKAEVNFLFLTSSDLEAWDKATTVMKIMYDAKALVPYKTKQQRVKMFEEIVVACGGSRPLLPNSSFVDLGK
jgi:hypothetical protein